MTNQDITTDLLNHLSNSLPKIRETINTPINCGGCGIFAKTMSDKLTELGIPHTIEATRHDTLADAKLVMHMNGEQVDLTYAVPTHILIKVKDHYLDSDGHVNHKVYGETLPITYDLLNKLIDKGSWNPWFERKYIPNIQQELTDIFNEFKQ